VCLGTPYFNWGPLYAELVVQVRDGVWEPAWDWAAPDWNDINNLDTSPVGFVFGDGLSEENAATLETVIADMAEYATNPFVPESFALWQGPLSLQDGTVLAEQGQLVPVLDVWYLPQLLDGMIGASE
jgi:simple sugar transport system substrate-binding protein